MSPPVRFALLCAAGVACAAPADAGIIRDDRTDAAHRDLAGAFPQVGRWGNGTGGTYLGLGTGGDWVLTARHVGIGAGQTFALGGATFTAAAVVNRADYVGVNALERGGDLTLVRLDPAGGSVFDRTGLLGAGYTARTDEVGRAAVVTGHGLRGTGLTGPAPGTAGPLRAGTNVLDALGDELNAAWDPRLLAADFDAPAGDANLLAPVGSAAAPTDLEFMLAAGDSGAGVFLDFGDGLGPVLAGVNSFVFDADGSPPYGFYGDGFAATRVSAYADWIALNTGIAAVSAVPEPATWALLGLALAGAAGARRRRA